jgi:hypothetical protein
VRSARFDAQALLPALRSFRGLPHRVEKIAEIDGVTWYDDSKGTNVGATVAALDGLGGMSDRKCVVILGGDGKAQDFSPLRDAVARHARAAILIGRDGPLIGRASRPPACRSKPPPTWTMPCVARPRWRSRATRRCCRRPAPASTCSATTSIAPRCSPPRCAAWSGTVSRAYRFAGQRMQRSPAELDPLLLWPALGLLLLGLVMVYSSSIALAEGSRFTGYQSAYFLYRHAVFVAIGFMAGVVAFQIPLRLWQQAAPWLFLAGVAAAAWC